MNMTQLECVFSASHFVGENMLAFETLELKACCNKNRATDQDEFLCALSADQLIDTQISLCLGMESPA